MTAPDGGRATPGAPRPDVQLLDCGDGRRLDAFGTLVLDRFAPALARVARLDRPAWAEADARYERRGNGGAWLGSAAAAEPWTVRIAGLRLELRLTATGQVGLFPEHVALWRAVRGTLGAKSAAVTARSAATTAESAAVLAGPPADSAEPPADAGPRPDRGRLRLLNLFAYTGGLSLAAAWAGAEVVHVDGSRTAVAWARRNAELSGLGAASIRWIVEDAETFVARELRRGNRYDGIVLDPPSYGHGPHGGAWRLEERLPDLLRACVALAGGRPALLIVSAHTPGIDAERLGRELLDAIPPHERGRGRVSSGALGLDARSGAHLPAGAFARWTAKGAR